MSFVPFLSEVGAVCGSSARTDLRGGCRVTGIPTAIDLDALAATIADDVVEHDVVPGMPPTKAGVIQFFTTMGQSFSNLTLTVHDMIAEGDKVFARATMSGTNVGEFMGMPATHKSIDVPVADYFRLENGKISEHWGVNDTGIMMQQLGAS